MQGCKRSSAQVLTSPLARDTFQNSLLPQGLLKEARAAQIINMNRECHSGRTREGSDAPSERRTGGPSRAGKRG